MKRFSLIGTGATPQSRSVSASERQIGSRVKYRHFVGTTLFIIASAVFCFYFIAFPLVKLRFTHGYPRFGTPPSPNIFKSDRYTWGWVFIYLLTAVNLMLPYLLAIAVVNNTMPEISKLHYFITRISIVLSMIVFIGLSVSWLLFCNRFFPQYSYCHDLDWCCAYFSSSVEASQWCPNTTPCMPDVTSRMLSRPDAFFQTWLFSLLFAFWGLAHRAVNIDLKGYGLWREIFPADNEAERQFE